MSFILDALKKSETERQQQSAAEFAGTPTGPTAQSVPRWLLVVGCLLAINLAVLIGLLLRSDDSATAETSPIVETAPVTQDAANDEPALDFEDRVAAAQRNRPEATGAAADAGLGAAAAATDRNQIPTQEPFAPVVDSPDGNEESQAAAARQLYPTVMEARASGYGDIPELHLDLHVYSASPKDRFVFINMTKLREGSQLREGPIVSEITPDGVVLGHRGQFFILPRE